MYNLDNFRGKASKTRIYNNCVHNSNTTDCLLKMNYITTIKQNKSPTDLTTRVNNLEMTTNELVTTTSNLFNDKNDVSNRTNELETTTSTLSNDITGVSNEIILIKNTTNSLETVMTNLSNDISDVSNRTNQLETEVTDLSNSIIEFISENKLSQTTIEKLKNACTQIVFNINGSIYNGSAWFYYEEESDLQHGYLITAAHCVMEINGANYYKTSELWFQNPKNKHWTSVDVNNIFIDGVGDIALIKTNIDLTNDSDYCLKLSVNDINYGDKCFVVGNPGGYDEDSFSIGSVRDPHYCETGGYQITDSIHITAPGMGGNSGGPIVDVNGDVIGIYTFGLTGNECFGAGSNRDVLQNSLEQLKQSQDNTLKRYLGLHWSIPNPFLMKNYYIGTSFSTNGVFINNISNDSPFYNTLNNDDLLLTANILTNEPKIIEFGNKFNEFTPGVLVYYYSNIDIEITYIKNGTKNKQTTIITLNKSYNDVPNTLDGPLQTGLSEIANSKLLHRIKIE